MRDQKGDGAELDHAASEHRVAQENGVAARPLDESVRFAIAAATGAPVLGALAPQALERAVRRAVLDRDDDGLFTPSSFHARFEMWAFFEGWCDLPDDVRRRLNEWELADYIGKIGPGVEAMRDGRAAESDQSSFTPSCCSTRRRRCCVPSPCLPVALQLPCHVGQLRQAAQRLPALRQRP